MRLHRRALSDPLTDHVIRSTEADRVSGGWTVSSLGENVRDYDRSDNIAAFDEYSRRVDGRSRVETPDVDAPAANAPEPDQPSAAGRSRAQRAARRRNGAAPIAATPHSAIARAGDAIVGSSPAINRVRELIDLYGPEDEPVLICGETGVGKEAIARRLHAASDRADGPLVVQNAGRIDRDLAGSHFFGHVRGAFTGATADRPGMFAEADGGALHLDEIGDLPFELQANFLRVVEDGRVTPVGANVAFDVNVRIIAATNVNLEAAIERGDFRGDLYHRLSALELHVPPLRDRGDDVVEIAEHFLDLRAARKGKRARLKPAAADRLLDYDWPGNVRELRNCMTRAAVHARDGDIGPDAIALKAPCERASLNIDEAKRTIARYLAAAALERARGNVSKAATLTGVNRTSFHALKKELGSGPFDLAALRASMSIYLWSE